MLGVHGVRLVLDVHRVADAEGGRAPTSRRRTLGTARTCTSAPPPASVCVHLSSHRQGWQTRAVALADVLRALRLTLGKHSNALTLNPAAFNSGTGTGGDPTCYSYIFGVSSELLLPGLIAGRRDDRGLQENGSGFQAVLSRMRQDGLRPFEDAPIDGDIVVAAFIGSDDAHFLRYDRGGWSEKRGEQRVSRVPSAAPWRLLRYKDPESGERYVFAGFHRLNVTESLRGVYIKP